MVNASLNLFAGSNPATSQLTTNQGETMTLTVQDLVTKLDDFADDAKIKVKRFYLLQETSITRDVVDIKKDDNGNVVLIEEDLSIRHDGRKASEGEESEDEESEDKESEGEESEDKESEDEESEGEE